VHGDDDDVESGAVDPRQQPSERRRHTHPDAAADTAARIEGGDGKEVLGNAPAVVGRREGEEAGAAGRGEDYRDVLGSIPPAALDPIRSRWIALVTSRDGKSPHLTRAKALTHRRGGVKKSSIGDNKYTKDYGSNDAALGYF
jgi:hypothetical protein